MCFIFLCLMIGEVCAYVMPLEQILEKVRKRFATLNTLIIEQSTHVIQSRDPLRERVFREKVWLKTPRYERTMAMAAPRLPKAENLPDQVIRQTNPDAAYRWFLMANPKGEISAFLSQLGIRIWGMTVARVLWPTGWVLGTRWVQNFWWTSNDFFRCFCLICFRGIRKAGL